MNYASQYALSKWDLIIIPTYFTIFIVAGFLISYLKYSKSNPKLISHFMIGLSLKLLGGISFGFLYMFYYKLGDTFSYYRNSVSLIELFFNYPNKYFEIITMTSVEDVFKEFPEFFSILDNKMRFNMFHSDTSFQVIRIASIFGILSFKSYFGITLFFSFFSFFGIWCLYRTFTRIYDHDKFLMALPFLYMPSIFFWGSPIMKDTVVIWFMGFLVYGLYMLFIERKKILLSIFLVVTSFFVLKTTKEYVIIAFVPSVILWLILSIVNNTGVYLKSILRPVLFVFIVFSIFLLVPYISKITTAYTLENVLATAELTGGYIYRVSVEGGGSAYSLGSIDYSPLGILKVFPKAVNVTFFRPYPWEVKNVVMLFSSLEAMLTLFFTIYVYYKVGVLNYFKILFDEPILLMCLSFSVIFGFAIGISTFNFGTLARYKIPCLAFYAVSVLIPYLNYKEKKLL